MYASGKRFNYIKFGRLEIFMIILSVGKRSMLLATPIHILFEMLQISISIYYTALSWMADKGERRLSRIYT